MSSGDGAEVSVIVTLFNYADVVIETLDSIVASADVVAEIVIVDDHSSDDGVDVVRQWMADHDDVAVLLLTPAANRGLTRARNLAIDNVRSDLVMMMDADNLVYPTCLRRLADALGVRPRGGIRVFDFRGVRRRTRPAQRTGMARSLVVRSELHRRPGDAATVDSGPPRGLSSRRHDVRLGGLGPVASYRSGRGVWRSCPRDARAVPHTTFINGVDNEPRS